MPPPRSERPPFYAILLHRPAPGADPMLHVDIVEHLIGLAAAEPGFLGIEEAEDDPGESFTVCYWRDAASLRRWQAEAPSRVPPLLPIETVIGPTGCLWPWLHDVREAQLRRPSHHTVPMYETTTDPTTHASESTAENGGKPLRRIA